MHSFIVCKLKLNTFYIFILQLTWMNTQQQYELKIGVYHHHSLKTNQLIEFLRNESNDFLNNDLPQNLMIRQSFYSSFEVINETESIDYSEYVGIIVLYSSSSLQTFQYAKSCIPPSDLLGSDIFFLLVEMDNTEKKLNTVGSQGQQLCQKLNLIFIRLTLYNSDDLVANLNRNIYLMIQNYYYPNQEQRNKVSFECQTLPNQFVLQYSDSENKIIATTEEKDKVMNLIQKAAQLRTSRERQIIEEQQAIDGSIENVEKVLNNINRHIKEKLQSNWFTNLRDSLYKPIQKESKTFNKIKLTQQFIDDQKPIKAKKTSYFKTKDFHESIYNSKFNSTLQMQLKKLQSSLMKIVIVLEDVESDQIVQTKIVELQVFQNSTYDELALNALKKLGLRQNDKNIKLMKEQVKNKIEQFIKQLTKSTKNIERQRTFQRSYLAVLKK